MFVGKYGRQPVTYNLRVRTVHVLLTSLIVWLPFPDADLMGTEKCFKETHQQLQDRPARRPSLYLLSLTLRPYIPSPFHKPPIQCLWHGFMPPFHVSCPLKLYSHFLIISNSKIKCSIAYVMVFWSDEARGKTRSLINRRKKQTSCNYERHRCHLGKSSQDDLSALMTLDRLNPWVIEHTQILEILLEMTALLR